MFPVIKPCLLLKEVMVKTGDHSRLCGMDIHDDLAAGSSTFWDEGLDMSEVIAGARGQVGLVSKADLLQLCYDFGWLENQVGKWMQCNGFI